MTKISDLITSLTATLAEQGDLEILVWGGKDPLSSDPRVVPAKAVKSSYYQTLPAAVYGAHHGDTVTTVAFLTTGDGARMIRENFARA